ncbi:MAG: M6 family metalloprotease domain-containing protein [Muribaculaceae bacterium]|nr:M6 family metalloprotease domain-containing protein [Muribaculaceae bacterium]
MKKLILLCAMGLSALCMVANHAVSKPASLRGQVKGQLDVRLHGDEFYNYYTTADGYTVQRNASGQWEYVKQQGDRLVSTGIKANNVGERTAMEQQLISAIDKRLVDRERMATAQDTRRKAHPQRAGRFNYNRFRGLIVLVEYTDLSFEMSNPQEFYNHMVNDRNYTGYTDKNGKRVSCTGSVRDYYYDQSGGLFDPVFDVVGPVRVSYKSTDHNQASSSPTIFMSALKAVDSQVDFTLYDGDDDGTIDLVFFIGAGPASCYEGNNSSLLWPHKYAFYLQSLLTRLDGMRPYDYACCSEIYGFQDTPSSLETQGIGVMCHEFSHVLGLMDHYDADGTSSGGQSYPMREWDIMDDGAANNVARTPSAYTLFERWSLGWCNPTVINKEGTYTLRAIDGTMDGCIMRTTSNELFTFENRQKTTKWDKYLPGHGMIITRVDSSSTTAWTTNKVNVNPSHLYHELIRAYPAQSDYGEASDPFPGTKTVTSITNTTSPNLKSWSGSNSPYCMWNIQEKNGVITFVALPNGQTYVAQHDVETFDKLPVGLESGVEARGDLATWVTNQATVANYGGSRKVSMPTISTITSTTPLYYDAYKVSIDVTNTKSATAKFVLYTSVDGNNWKAYSQAQAAAGTTTTLEWDVNLSVNDGVFYRVAMVTKDGACYVDNFSVYYNGEPGTPISTDPSLMETFDKLPVGLASGVEAVGDIATWKSTSATIASYEGSRQVKFTLPSTMQTTTPLYYAINLAVLTATNPQTAAAKLALYYSVDNGNKWTVIPTREGAQQLTVPAGETAKGLWNLNFTNDQPVLYRIAMVGGNKNAPCYVDNFTLYYTGEPGSGRIPGDVNGDGGIDIDDVNIAINIILEMNTDADAKRYADANGDGNVDIDDINAMINIILAQ